MKKVTNNFAALSLGNFAKKLKMIVTSMTGNGNFPNLQTEVTALSTAATEYYALEAAAEKRDQDAVIDRNAARVHITTLLHNLGVEVTAVAKGDVSVLSSSGFNFTKTREKSSPLQKPKNPVLSNGVNSGMINCKTSPQYALKSNTYYITEDASALIEGSVGGWQAFPASGSSFDFTDLVPARRYYVKVGQVGVRGQLVFSDPVSFICQ